MTSSAERVLLVGLDGSAHPPYREGLSDAGYEVEHASDGRDALAQIFARRPMVVVTDTTMPFIDGYQLCAILRGDAKTSSVGIVLIERAVGVGSGLEGRTAGADTVLAGAIAPAELIAAVGRVKNPRAAEPRNEPAPTRWPRERPGSTRTMQRSAGKRLGTRTFQRFATTEPPLQPPMLMCACCDRHLEYDHSQIGGVSNRDSEQWDYYSCRSCGTFQYRHRTRRVRPVG